ncbi:protein CHUP1, chloroplastic-like isoform X2 [Hibiscus syriacus]|uniref:protein CHUP1, chloroplastic-like isoform X2 n=1 Tax=Hibiscus syriacus TaxID=106335 RepID=UPI00192321F1|nr:protein CHUP1, chloroplastic-like isoform X2 [Hibiscus syriacus]
MKQLEPTTATLKPPHCKNPRRTKAKDQSSRPQSVLPDSTKNSSRKSLVMKTKPKSGDQLQLGGCYQKGRVVEQFGRPRRPNVVKENTSSTEKKNSVDGLREKLSCTEGLVKDLQAQMKGLRAELDGARSLNMELELINRKLREDLAAAEVKLAALSSPHPGLDQVQLQRESSGEYQSPKFKDIQKLIANKLEHPKVIRETKIVQAPLMETACLTSKDASSKTGSPIIHSLPPPPPPPLPPPRFPAKGATTPKAHYLIVDLLTRAEKKKDPSAAAAWNQKKPTIVSVHSSIVGEIQNRSAHLLAIKTDVETKGEFINSLIHRVLVAAYTDIEDVVKFINWLDKELASLADERAVLKHFKWPERKADAMREAAIEYRDLKLLETEISSYEDDTGIPCGSALKKMAGLLDKSEKSIQGLIKLRNSVMRSYQECKIPVDWMLDSGMVFKIKQASMKLVTMYIKRVGTELQSVRSLDKETAREALLLQGMHFANRAHQFAGDLDSETLCAFEEIRQCIPGHLVGSKGLLTGISSA